jgi:hypothetical protein
MNRNLAIDVQLFDSGVCIKNNKTVGGQDANGEHCSFFIAL